MATKLTHNLNLMNSNPTEWKNILEIEVNDLYLTLLIFLDLFIGRILIDPIPKI